MRSDLLPPQTHDEHGKLRRVGVEIEVLNLSIERASGLVIELFGGHAVRDNEYQMTVLDTSLGKFGVEVDSTPLKAIAKKRTRMRVIGAWDRLRERFFGAVAEHVTPTEIVTAPIARSVMAQIAEDESRHAQLSWALRAWLESQLSTQELAQVDEASESALSALASDLDPGLSCEECALLGFPTPEVSRSMLRSLSQALYA